MLITDRQGNAQKRFPSGGTRPAIADFKNPRNPVANGTAWNSKYSAFPVGAATGALTLPMGEGGMGAKMQGLGSLAGAINGRAQAASSLTGTSAVTVPSYGLTMLVQAVAALTASGDVSASINGRAGMEAAINVSQLTENDVAGVVLDAPIDGSYTLRQVLAILAAVAAGKTTIVPGLPTEAAVTFRDLSDTKNVVVADMVSSERANVTLDAG